MTPVAVITGASGGLGAACARRLAPDHRLLLADVSVDGLRAMADALRAEGADVATCVCDVSDAEATRRLAEASARRGPLAALVHTAGISRSMADGPAIVAVNLIGTAHVLEALRPLAEAGTTAVCVSSIGAYRQSLLAFDALLADPLAPGFVRELERRVTLAGHPGVAYDLAKRGVVLLCERGAAAWGRRGARIVAVSPGPIDTPMGALEAEHGARGLDRLAALGRVAAPEEVADVIAMLCSPAAAFVTGCDLRVDGGLVAHFRHHAAPRDAEAWESLRP